MNPVHVELPGKTEGVDRQEKHTLLRRRIAEEILRRRSHESSNQSERKSDKKRHLRCIASGGRDEDLRSDAGWCRLLGQHAVRFVTDQARGISIRKALPRPGTD